MIVFPNAKINIGLNVVEKRPDGFHNIESCFYPAPWQDALEIVEANQFSFESTGIPIPGKGNICTDAYELLKKDFDLPPISIHLHKNIPIGAGLGGGSADGAFMLKLLNEKFSLGLDNEQLRAYAEELGSDCPFFIDNQPAFVEGTGNIFSDITIDLKGYWVVIIYPEIHVNTTGAYKGITPNKSERSVKEVLQNSPVDKWKELVSNDFEDNTDQEILKLKQDLYDKGAIYASMTGSGSAVYGLFFHKPGIKIHTPHLIRKL
ncbi:MAG: 4-(cytidine 5'-diphospho)-2-C-methyl-D-erythritol kinase [Bacteroidota bacterium]